MKSPDIQETQVRPTQLLSVTNIAITSSGVGTLCNPSDQRKYLEVINVGLTTVWIGATSSMTIGATGNNIGFIAVNGSKSLEGYGDYLYARYHGASDAGAHVVKVYEY